ncbi:MAG: alanyl-tRNA synthetase, partial [Parcubacteria group bacterium Greene0714_36]
LHMESSQIRKKFFAFFERHGHKRVASSSLIPDDPSVLLTTAGMQQFKKYYTDPEMADRDFGSRNTVSIQKSFRTSDIDEVGDERHLTFFEMMGNFSFGGYFKEKAIALAHEFLTSKEWMGLDISYVTIFQGKNAIGVPKDEESVRIWLSLGITDIREEGMDDVFWGPTGSGGPCGPTTEIYCRNDAGEDIEVWNIVFNEFFFPGSREELLSGSLGKKLERLKTPGVDTGMGLERLAMCSQETRTIFETDLFKPFVATLAAFLSESTKRIIVDHARAIVFLISDGVLPSNKDAGYVLRRLMRRYIVRVRGFGDGYFTLLIKIVDYYKNTYPELKRESVLSIFKVELDQFEKTLDRGLYELEKAILLDGPLAFKLYQSYGLPFEIIKDLGGERAKSLSRKEFDEEFRKHQEISRAGFAAKFGGHGLYLKTGEVTIRDESEVEKVTRLHTATHLLHAGLRAVLGPEVRQDGSDITVERTRFDFKFPRKVTPEELQKVEQWVNNAVRRDLTVAWEEMSYEEGIKKGALGFFREKYPPRVKIYTMTDPATGEVLSCEFCGGPHVMHTAEVGTFKIIKEEASSAGVRRIRGIVE